MRDWKVSSKEGQQYLDVYFNFGIKGGYVLNLSYERKIGEGSVVAQVPWVKALGVEREKGFFGLAAATNVELTVNKIEHASVIDVKELPGAISSSTTNPILLAFKYLNHPFNITIDVTKHEELPVLVAAIDSVDYVTLQTDEGKNLTKAIYQVRNNVKQFIHIGLPKQAVLWSAFVAGKPVKPAKDRDGSILIPLEKSRLEGESLAQFPVEIVYLDKANKMSWLGGFRLSLPKTDIPISELNWSVYLPLDYAYFNFSGDIKQAQMPALWNQGARPEGSMGIQAKKAVRKDKYTYREAQQQVLEDMGFSQEQSVAMKGVLPIKIGVPEQGRLYRFAKLLVIEKESPWFSVSFIKIFKPLRWLVWVLIIAAILAVVGAVLKRNKK